MTIKITFDTNCILNDEKYGKKPYYNQIKALENFEIRGFVKIFKTNVQDTEIYPDAPQQKSSDTLLRRLKQSEKFEELQGIAVVGYTRLNHGKVSSDNDADEFCLLNKDQKQNKNKTDVSDLMTLHTLKNYGNEFLVTNNVKDFLFDTTVQIIDPVILDADYLNQIQDQSQLKSYLEFISRTIRNNKNQN